MAATQESAGKMPERKTREGRPILYPGDGPGTPEEIADLTHFLVSDFSRYMTGEIIVLGGA